MSDEVIGGVDHLPDFAAGLAAAIAKGLDAGLAKIEEAAKADAPRASGALAASGYRITPLVNEYDEAVGAMESLNEHASASEQPYVEPGEGIVGFAADYALPVHDGHHTRSGGYVAGQPFLSQATEAGQNQLEVEIALAVGELAALLDVD